MLNALIPLVLIVASAAVPPMWGELRYEPVSSEAYTEDLEAIGYNNGRMPEIRMIEVSGCLLERDAAYTLALMIEAAHLDGVALSPGDCYRSFEAQRAAYTKRCPEVDRELTTYDPVTEETVVVGYVTERQCSGPPIALPGTSNHGWGRAIDFTTNGTATLTCNTAEFGWLNENAGDYGWVHPGWAHCGRSTSEPWHWEWGGVQEVEPPPPFTAPASMLQWAW